MQSVAKAIDLLLPFILNNAESLPGDTTVLVWTWWSYCLYIDSLLIIFGLDKSFNKISCGESGIRISEKPEPALAADSTIALVNPAAPKSCIPTKNSLVETSIQASINTFSKKGLPTWTVGLKSCSSSKLCEAKPEAPWIPSFPVSAPTNINTFPSFPVVARIKLSVFTIPTHIAFTKGLPE